MTHDQTFIYIHSIDWHELTDLVITPAKNPASWRQKMVQVDAAPKTSVADPLTVSNPNNQFLALSLTCCDNVRFWHEKWRSPSRVYKSRYDHISVHTISNNVQSYLKVALTAEIHKSRWQTLTDNCVVTATMWRWSRCSAFTFELLLFSIVKSPKITHTRLHYSFTKVLLAPWW